MSRLLNRRGALAAATLGAGAAVWPNDAVAAVSLAALPRPGRYTPTPVPTVATRHLLNRFSCGVTPGLFAEARAAGGANAWFERQLDPAAIADSVADNFVSWFPDLELSPGVLWDQREDGMLMGTEVTADLQRLTMLRRIYSSRQLLEVMVEFWSNVMHVPVPDEKTWPHRPRFDKVIRKHALGRFDELLAATVLHPAMLCYLDNAVSSSRDPNENLGRELLECHTIGQESGLITEGGVWNSTMILSGYMVDMWETWAAFYSEDDHYVGPVAVVGFEAANSSPDGRQVAQDYLKYLANHPATARRLARRLCQRFISDAVSSATVQDVADAYLAADTDIKATLRALVKHPEFLASVGQKVRTPTQDLSATYRALGAKILKGTGVSGEAVTLIPSLLFQAGQEPFGWPRPDGFPEADDTWASSARMLASWKIHHITCGQQSPTRGIEYRAAISWIPELPIRFDLLVDHLARVLLAKKSTALMLQACCDAMGWGPTENIDDTSHPLVRYKIPPLLLTLLDTPEFMTR